MDFKVEAEKNFVGRTSINASFGHVCSCSFRVLQVIISVESVFLTFVNCLKILRLDFNLKAEKSYFHTVRTQGFI